MDHGFAACEWRLIPVKHEHLHWGAQAHHLQFPLNIQHSTLNTQHSTLDTRHSTLDTQRSTLNTQHSTLNTQLSTLNPQPSTHNPRQPHNLRFPGAAGQNGARQEARLEDAGHGVRLARALPRARVVTYGAISYRNTDNP